jgi:ligand-binding SRPBCC domain-containing protein
MRLPLGIERVFGFFSDASNLERITPPELRFRTVSPQPIRMAEGSVIDFRLRLLGIPFGWRTRISVWEPPYHFVDEQLQGPYRIWVHSHRFSEAEGFTTIVDDVRYALPCWPLGQLAYPFVYTMLEHIFQFRREATAALLLPLAANDPNR